MTQSCAKAIVLAVLTLLFSSPVFAQWAAEPSATVRNAFGPAGGGNASQCRGACGAGCPDTCTKEVVYECAGSEKFYRIESLSCGTHPGCRAHDDCLDSCVNNGTGGDCQAKCDGEVMQTHGFENSSSWLMGKGPYDGKIKFEYTIDDPNAPEPAFRCPTGASPQCAGTVGCKSSQGDWVEPVFDTYPASKAGAMTISDLRTGPACGDSVCDQTASIRVTGSDSCAGGDCTRFGIEFDYKNADPSEPLKCRTSTSGGDGDFIGDLIKLGADATVRRSGNETNKQGSGEDGMAELLGMFSKVIASADSPEDLNVSITPLDEDGNPIESKRVNSQPSDDGLPPIPTTIDIPAKSGHLFVPMYQLSSNMSSVEKERKIFCTHKGQPVLETAFRLQPG